LTISVLPLAFCACVAFPRARTVEIDGSLCRGPVIGRLRDAYGSNHTALLTNLRAISPYHFKPPTHRLGLSTTIAARLRGTACAVVRRDRTGMSKNTAACAGGEADGAAGPARATCSRSA
jgi:hypothetical protein